MQKSGSVLRRVQMFERNAHDATNKHGAVHPFNRTHRARNNIETNGIIERPEVNRSSGIRSDRAQLTMQNVSAGKESPQNDDHSHTAAGIESPMAEQRRSPAYNYAKKKIIETRSSPIASKTLNHPALRHAAVARATDSAFSPQSKGGASPRRSPRTSSGRIRKSSPSPTQETIQFKFAKIQGTLDERPKPRALTEPSSPLKSLSTRASRYFGNVRTRTSAHNRPQNRLRGELNAATAALAEERSSSYASSSSSRSSLSQKELGSIAKRAFSLSQATRSTRVMRMEKAPISKMLSHKRSPTIAIEGNPVTMAQSNDDSHHGQRIGVYARFSPNSAVSSTKSSRLSRAERVAVLKQHNSRSYTPTSQFDSSITSSTLSSEELGGKPVQSSPNTSQSKPVQRMSGQSNKARQKKVETAKAYRRSNTSDLYKARPRSGGNQSMEKMKVSIKNDNIYMDGHVPISRDPAFIGSRAPSRPSKVGVDVYLSTEDRIRQAADALTPKLYNEQEFMDPDEADTLEHSSFLHEDTIFTADEPRLRYPAYLPEPKSQDKSQGDSRIDRVSSKSTSHVSSSMLRGEDIAQYRSDGSELVYSSNSGSNSRIGSTTLTSSLSNSKSSTSQGQNGCTTRKLENPKEESQNNNFDVVADNATSKEEAMRWWQKTYGNKVSGDTNQMIRKVFSAHKRKSETQARSFRHQEQDDEEVLKATNVQQQLPSNPEDDEDIFFGLDDESKASRKSTGPAHSRSTSSHKQRQGDVSHRNTDPLQMQSSSVLHQAGRQPPLSPRALNTNTEHQPDFHYTSNRDQDERAPTGYRSHSSENVASVPEKSRNSAVMPTVFEEASPTTNDSCEENADPGLKQRAKTTYDHGSEENSITIEESLPGAQKDTNQSVLTNLGAVIANSIDLACIPDKDTAESRCKDGANACTAYAGNVTALDEEETMFMGEEDRSYISMEHTNQLESTVYTTYTNENSGMHNLGRVEEESVGIRQRPTASSSLLNSDRQSEQHKERRQLAQTRLLDHAQKAIKMLESLARHNEDQDNENQDPVEEPLQETPPDETTKCVDNAEPSEPSVNLPAMTPRTLAAEISKEERIAVASFSSQLRSRGIEVLKLNRRGKWQTRYLTVSRDTATTVETFVCPSALLWLKHPPGPGPLLLEENDGGRGGFYFDALASIETKFNSPPPCAIPKKFKKVFHEYVGVVVEYDCEDGIRTLSLCFQSRIQASSFWTAMKILREVVTREEGLVREEQEIVTGIA